MMRRLLLVAALAVACNDPVHDAEVAALGPEDPNVPPGPNHRPGQPCLTCHDNFSIGGTVYEEDLMTPYDGATVQLVDATGSQYQTTTNMVGNFYVLKTDWMPVFPIGTYTDDAGTVYGVQVIGTMNPQSPAQMLTHIGRDGSCADCHYGTTPDSSTPGRIYLTQGS